MMSYLGVDFRSAEPEVTQNSGESLFELMRERMATGKTGPMGITGVAGPKMGAIGATGSTSYGATGAATYPYSALSPHAKQAEDREAEIERIARLMASAAHPMIDPDHRYVPYLPQMTPLGGYFIENSSLAIPFWRGFSAAAAAVYEDRRK